VARDSLFGETILWSGRPRVVAVPQIYKLVAGAGAALAIVSLS
jgi:hypothetical protein